MDSTQFLNKAPSLPGPAEPFSAASLSRLPADMLQEGVRRLGYAGLIYAATYTLAYFGSSIFDWISDGSIPEYLRSPRTIVAVTAIALGLGLFILTRLNRIRPTLLLNLGLVFEVIGALGIAATSVYGVFPAWSENPLTATGYMGIPWECNWIVIFPMIAPNTPRKILIASLAAASMGPLVVLVSKATGATSADAPMSFFFNYYLFTTYLCAVLAFIGSRIIFQFGLRLRKAREFGQYQMVEQLGRGGMGEVWRATHRMLARSTAIKLIRPETVSGDPQAQGAILRRFEREAQATAALRSVHTIDVFDFGITVEGAFYYVMEMLDGCDLEALVKKHGPVPAGRVIHFLRQACHSLREAHAAGLIHRDIKPANLFVCRLGPDDDFVKVLDFGLVKSSPEITPDKTDLTQAGTTFGTPSCMPPEMAMDSADADGRSDLYSLGCVGYWLLTGRTVFEAESALALVVHHVKTAPEPPSRKSEIPVPEDLERVILACLAKNPADRPQSAAELDGMLAACQGAEPWTAAMAAAWWETHEPADQGSPA